MLTLKRQERILKLMNYQANLTTRTVVAKANDGSDRHATFIASSKSVDRDNQTMDLDSLTILTRDGNGVLVKNIGSEGLSNVDIPLTLNHSYAVEDVIGSVDKVIYDSSKGEITFDARFSNRPKAQDVFKLLEEGHLSNAFSISAFDVEIDRDGAIRNGTLNAVGLVERGANPDAKLLAVKGLEEKAEAEVETESTEEKDEQEADSEAKTEETEGEAEKTEAEETEAEKPAEETAEAEEADKSEEEKEPEADEAETDTAEADEQGENPMNEEVAKSLVKEAPAQPIVTTTAEKNYLDSNKAMHDFAQHIIANKGMSSDAVMSSWKNKIADKAISGDAFLPTPIVSIFKGWEDHSEILRTFVSAPKATRTIYAFTGQGGTIGEDMRAKGHKKGEQKANQAPYLYERDVKGKLIYKKLPIDLQDLLDDETGELSRIRLQELVARIDDEAERSSIIGDGRSEATPDYRIYDGSRGIIPMTYDLGLITANASNSATYYAKTVGSVITTGGTNAYEKAKLTIAKVAGDRKYIALPTGTLAELEIARATDSGAYLFPNGVNFGANVTVFERDWMTGSGYDVIAWGADGYELFYGNSMVRTDFDLDYNLDVVLAERYASGSAKGYKKIAGYKTSGTTA